MTQKTEAEKYFAKLKRLIKNPPSGISVSYDYMSTELYVFDKTAQFIDKEPESHGSAIVGSTTPQNAMGYGSDTGYERDSIIGSIFVPLEAKQS